MPSYYCNALKDNMISKGENSQVKFYGGDGTSSKTWIEWDENEVIPEKKNYMSKNSGKVEPITTHGPPEMIVGKMGNEMGRISMHVGLKW